MAEILLTDDDADVRMLIRGTLERAGHLVSVAANGTEALNLLGTKTFDLVITDVNMPEIDGIELTRLLHLQASPPKIIAISGHDVVNLEMLEMLGAKASLAKPFTPKQLTDLVTRVLSTARDD
jgi:CheY-like chemotaxis protein